MTTISPVLPSGSDWSTNRLFLSGSDWSTNRLFLAEAHEVKKTTKTPQARTMLDAFIGSPPLDHAAWAVSVRDAELVAAVPGRSQGQSSSTFTRNLVPRIPMVA